MNPYRIKIPNRAKRIIIFFFVMIISSSLFSQSGNYNYIRIRSTNRAITTITKLDQLTANKDSVQTNIQYNDGLGRALQTVSMRASPTGMDVVQPFVYDAVGRQSKIYLPYTVNNATASNGSYKNNVIASQNAFFNSPPAGVVQILSQNGSTPSFSETQFELSSMGRIQQQGFPGSSWSIASGHTLKLSYSTNNTNTEYSTTGFAVRAYFAVPVTASGQEYKRTLSGTGYYNAGQLRLKISKDEDWIANDGKAGTKEEYIDKEGKIILKRVFNESGSIIQTLSTYYVYDDMGNLSFVLPPGSNPDDTTVPTQTVLNNYCYQYRYDSRSRLIEKMIPGKGWEYAIYNKLNQPVLTQDSLQRINSKWLFAKYDALGRAIITGITDNSNNRQILQASVDAQTIFWEQRDSANSSGTGTGYSNNTIPKTTISAYHIVNYYDDYSIWALPIHTAYNQSSNYSSRVYGLPTVSKTLIIGTANYLWSINYYDDEARVVKTVQQHYKGEQTNPNNYDERSISYNFSGQPILTIRKHFVNNVENLYVYNEYQYDHLGRKIETRQKTGDNSATTNPLIILSRNDYTELGQLKTKAIHSTNSGTSFAQTITYSYNPRGWLKSQSAPLFTQNLKYDDQIGGVKARYNGNISRQEWGANKYYNYNYDKLNRLISALSDDNNNEIIGYDLTGNISRLKRLSENTIVDQLQYTYAGSNKLIAVLDTNITLNTAYQIPGTTSYSYDGNGNMVTRNNVTSTGNNISGITYNYLNFPINANANGAIITYTYDASGSKLKKLVTGNQSVYNEYISGIQYDRDILKSVVTETGRVVRNSTTNFSYEYTFADHLGNGRVYFDINEGVARKIQEFDYYAYGLSISRSLIGTENKYQYNNKEKQDQEKMYDFGARVYDPVIGRWMAADPLAEQMRRESPYNYGFNNPIGYVDPDGMHPVWNGQTGSKTGYYDSETFLPVSPEDVREYILQQDGPGKPKPKQKPLGPYLFKWNPVVYNPKANLFLTNGDDGSIMRMSLILGAETSEVPPLAAAIVAAAAVYTYGPGLINKMADEIDRIYQKTGGSQGFTYELRVRNAGTYLDVRGNHVDLNAQDIWKYGQTTSGNRYSTNELNNMVPGGVYQNPIFNGNQIEIKVFEKYMIYRYYFNHGSLPPGNSILR